MNAKKDVLNVSLIVLVATLMTGCCSMMVVDRARQTTEDAFWPVAVYQSTNGSGLALEGNLHPVCDKVGKESQSHSYLLISKASPGSLTIPTNSLLALDWIKSFPPDYFAKHSKLEKQLPANYEKMAVLPEDSVRVTARKHYPERAALAILPVTLAFDAATSPLQAIGALLWIVMWHNGGC